VSDTDRPPAAPAELAALEALIEDWLREEQVRNPSVTAVDRGEPDERRWYVRLRGEQKETFAVWLTLGQRTLAYETYVMPAPEENHPQLYEHLLRRNLRLNGVAFAIGAEDAVYLRGQLPVHCVDRAELDRILGSLYAHVEAFFRPAMRIGFASRFVD
jgi:hypothetical protein